MKKRLLLLFSFLAFLLSTAIPARADVTVNDDTGEVTILVKNDNSFKMTAGSVNLASVVETFSNLGISVTCNNGNNIHWGEGTNYTDNGATDAGLSLYNNRFYTFAPKTSGYKIKSIKFKHTSVPNSMLFTIEGTSTENISDEITNTGDDFYEVAIPEGGVSSVIFDLTATNNSSWLRMTDLTVILTPSLEAYKTAVKADIAETLTINSGLWTSDDQSVAIDAIDAATDITGVTNAAKNFVNDVDGKIVAIQSYSEERYPRIVATESSENPWEVKYSTNNAAKSNDFLWRIRPNTDPGKIGLIKLESYTQPTQYWKVWPANSNATQTYYTVTESEAANIQLYNIGTTEMGIRPDGMDRAYGLNLYQGSSNTGTIAPWSKNDPGNKWTISEVTPITDDVVLDITPSDITLAIGGTEQLNYQPSNLWVNSLTWSSDNIDAVSVNDDGLATGVATGNANITFSVSIDDVTKTSSVANANVPSDLHKLTLLTRTSDGYLLIGKTKSKCAKYA